MWHQLHTFLLHTSRIVLLLYIWVCAGSKQLFCDWGPRQECYIATDIWAFYGQQQQGVLMVRNVFSVFWRIWMQKIIGPACVVINTLTECPILHINTPGPWGGLLDSHLESVCILISIHDLPCNHLVLVITTICPLQLLWPMKCNEEWERPSSCCGGGSIRLLGVIHPASKKIVSLFCGSEFWSHAPVSTCRLV